MRKQQWIGVLVCAVMLAPKLHAAELTSTNTHHAAETQITPENVGRLRVAWQFRTGELGEGLVRSDKLSFETVPLVVGRRVYVTTAVGKVFALDGTTGKELWQFDPKIDRLLRYSEVANRGVAYWRGTQDAGVCSERVFLGTLDARLIAIDAATGAPCVDFGDKGEIALYRGVRLQNRPDYTITSPPTVVGDIVITGSAIGDNRATNVELGVVRAYDAVTGKMLWHWDPIPRTAAVPPRAADPDFGEVSEQVATWTGGANAWITLAGDAARDLVFVPTGSAAPDFFGGASVRATTVGPIPL